MNDQLTLDDLRAYQSGRLSGPARHRVERLMLEYPFYADALAGLEAMQQTATDTSAEQLASLRYALHDRIHASANQKRLWPLWIATTTAAILFMLVMAVYFIYFAPKHQKKKLPNIPPATTQFRHRSFGKNRQIATLNLVMTSKIGGEQALYQCKKPVYFSI